MDFLCATNLTVKLNYSLVDFQCSIFNEVGSINLVLVTVNGSPANYE
jgi:hypothetical protein